MRYSIPTVRDEVTSMAVRVQTMRADAKQLAGTQADLTPLLGTWSNVLPETDYLTKIIVAERNGRLLVRAYGSASPEPTDWGQVEASAYVAGGTTRAAGFHARYELGAVRTELAANEKLGILVILSYTSFDDSSGRLGHVTREFFRR
jgi:hypothetical protein